MEDNFREDDDLSDAPALPGDRYGSNTPFPTDTGYRTDTAQNIDKIMGIVSGQLTEIGSRWEKKENKPDPGWFPESTYSGRNGDLQVSGEDETIEVFYSIDDNAILPEKLFDRAEELEYWMRGINSELPRLFATSNGISMVFGDEIEDYEDEMEVYLRDFAHLADFADRESEVYDPETDKLDEFF
ncbi:MAG: hypothetical protein ACI8Z7_000274 [Candidatus Nanohaloarchaea archaeon]|jgi:hypothetical protein